MFRRTVPPSIVRGIYLRRKMSSPLEIRIIVSHQFHDSLATVAPDLQRRWDSFTSAGAYSQELRAALSCTLRDSHHRIGNPNRPRSKLNPEIPSAVISRGGSFSPPSLRIWLRVRGLGQRRKRNQRYTALMSTDPNMTGNPNLKNCQNEMG